MGGSIDDVIGVCRVERLGQVFDELLTICRIGFCGAFEQHAEDELLKRAEAIPLAFQPGDKWSYSNLGYVLLGILIHKVSGKFYGDFLQERVFQPLGMTTARIISEADIVPNRAAGAQKRRRMARRVSQAVEAAARPP